MLHTHLLTSFRVVFLFLLSVARVAFFFKKRLADSLKAPKSICTFSHLRHFKHLTQVDWPREAPGSLQIVGARKTVQAEEAEPRDGRLHGETRSTMFPEIAPPRLLRALPLCVLQGFGRQVLGEAIESVVLLLSPITPHICHALWQALGHEAAVIDEPWPEALAEALASASSK